MLERIAIEPLQHGVRVIEEYAIVVYVGYLDVLPLLIYIHCINHTY